MREYERLKVMIALGAFPERTLPAMMPRAGWRL
jgi:hypothetical protein